MCPIGKEGSQVRQEIPEEGRRAHWPKCCTDNNKDEDNSLNNPNNTDLKCILDTFLICKFLLELPAADVGKVHK